MSVLAFIAACLVPVLAGWQLHERRERSRDYGLRTPPNPAEPEVAAVVHQRLGERSHGGGSRFDEVTRSERERRAA